MTEDSPLKDDDYLVRVKAQVMCRDDSSGGWVPNGGGGMSIVGIRKVTVPVPNADDVRHEYLIHGQRMADQSVVLNCVLKKDVCYNQVTPTFHHWKTEEKRFGLTFQSSVDAGAFYKGIKRAVEDLMEDSPDSSNLHLDVGDDEVFMTLELPWGRKDSGSQSASTASTTTSSPTPQSPAVSMQDPFNNNTNTALTYNNSHLHRVHYISRPPPRHTQQLSPHPSDKSSKSSSESNGKPEESWELRDKHRKPHQGSENEMSEIVDYSYVQFKKTPSLHEYSYPTLDNISKSSQQRRDSVSSVKKQAIALQPALPIKGKSKNKSLSRKDKKQSRHLLSQRSRCVYCHEMFVHDDNHRGSCEDAPDKVTECIEKATCIWCANLIIYHCMADTDGNYGHPCVCDCSDDSNTKKWTAMTILSIFVPCLWCYLPLTACHRCGVACNCCGGRHRAQ